MNSADDNRSRGRIDTIKARFVFEGASYDVVDISAGGMLIECAEGFPSATVERLGRGSFEFRLLDPGTGSEIEFVGEVVRSEQAQESDRPVRIGLIFKSKNTWTRPLRQDVDRIKSAGQRGKTLAIGGGKGGVGKTIISVNLSLALSEMGKSVTLFDGDFGNGNCNTLLGITRVDRSLEEYLRRECSLEAITVSTPYVGLRLVCAAQNKVDDLLAKERPRLLDDLRLIDSDCLVIDLGAGVSDETLDLYRSADERIVIVTPQFTALQNAYSFIKSAFYFELECAGSLAAILNTAGADPQRLQALVSSLPAGHNARREFSAVLSRQRFSIVGNMVNGDGDVKIINNLQKVVKDYLHIESTVLGTLETSTDILHSVNRIKPFLALDPVSPQSQEIKWLAARLLKG
ncbi:MAG: P-loop NTPase [Pseudomonadota bacterium]